MFQPIIVDIRLQVFILSALLMFGELEVATVMIQRKKKECTEFHVVELSH